MNLKEKKQKPWLTLSRIAGLTDAMFAIVMTLLILSLDAPEQYHIKDIIHLKFFLTKQWHVLYIYVISFLILAKFWIDHHSQFTYLKATNLTHLWLNIIFLMFVALLPFTSSLSGDFPQYWLAQTCFHINMFLISITFVITWNYAFFNRRLTEDYISRDLIKFSNLFFWVTPVISIICLILAIFIPYYSSLPYLLIPIINRLLKTKFKKFLKK